MGFGQTDLNNVLNLKSRVINQESQPIVQWVEESLTYFATIKTVQTEIFDKPIKALNLTSIDIDLSIHFRTKEIAKIALLDFYNSVEKSYRIKDTSMIQHVSEYNNKFDISLDPKFNNRFVKYSINKKKQQGRSNFS